MRSTTADSRRSTLRSSRISCRRRWSGKNNPASRCHGFSVAFVGDSHELGGDLGFHGANGEGEGSNGAKHRRDSFVAFDVARFEDGFHLAVGGSEIDLVIDADPGQSHEQDVVSVIGKHFVLEDRSHAGYFVDTRAPLEVCLVADRQRHGDGQMV